MIEDFLTEIYGYTGRPTFAKAQINLFRVS